METPVYCFIYLNGGEEGHRDKYSPPECKIPEGISGQAMKGFIYGKFIRFYFTGV